MRFIPSRTEAGDTIVEVMIAIAVISSVLVGAFLVSSTSTRSVQDTGERAQALQVAQSQVEMIRAYVGGGGSFSPATNYCMQASDSYKMSVSDTNNCDPADNASRGAQFRPTFTKNGPTYTVTVTWDGLKSVAQVQLAYRIYSAGEVLVGGGDARVSDPVSDPDMPPVDGDNETYPTYCDAPGTVAIRGECLMNEGAPTSGGACGVPGAFVLDGECWTYVEQAITGPR
jgi:type II secretory pathway pseudopilin PulG